MWSIVQVMSGMELVLGLCCKDLLIPQCIALLMLFHCYLMFMVNVLARRFFSQYFYSTISFRLYFLLLVSGVLLTLKGYGMDVLHCPGSVSVLGRPIYLGIWVDHRVILNFCSILLIFGPLQRFFSLVPFPKP